MDLPKGQVAKFLIGGLIIIVILWAIFWILENAAGWIYRTYRNSMQRLWQKTHAAQTYKWIANPLQPEDDMGLRLLFMAGIFLILFTIMWVNVKMHGLLTQLNQEIMFFLANGRHPFSHHIMIHATLLGSKITLVGILILYSLYLLKNNNKRAVFFLLLCSALTAIATFGTKLKSQPQTGFDCQGRTQQLISERPHSAITCHLRQHCLSTGYQ